MKSALFAGSGPEVRSGTTVGRFEDTMALRWAR